MRQLASARKSGRSRNGLLFLPCPSGTLRLTESGEKMTKDRSFWLQRLANLKIDRARGDPAPHKPFLLLVVLEMADRGEITEQELPLSPDLAFRFSLFNAVIADRRRPPLELRLPFHHLKTSGIWEPLMADGLPSPHRNLTVKVRFDRAFLECLLNSSFRETAKRVLIETPGCFRPAERLSLYAMLRMTPPRPGRVNADRTGDLPSFYDTAVQRGRNARFRIEVVLIAYRHTCALTGYRMTTLDNESILDGRRLFLPADTKYWPDPARLAWHRDHRLGLSTS